LVLQERKTTNDRGNALDLIANMKQPGAARGLFDAAIKKSAPPPFDIPNNIGRQACAGRITDLSGVAKRLLDRFIGVYEREKSKVAVGSWIDEDIHIGIGFGFIARMRSE
jgi:hypothetical protein